MGRREKLLGPEVFAARYGELLAEHHGHRESCEESLRLARAATAKAIRLREADYQRYALTVRELAEQLETVTRERDAALRALASREEAPINNESTRGDQS